MPVYPLTTAWSDPISLLAGDIVQNQSPYKIEITTTDPEVDPARLILPGHCGALQVDGAVDVRARMEIHDGSLHVIRGF